MSKSGYHLIEIEKGKLGEFSKIEEEFNELLDAHIQNDPILMLCECSDLIGAIKHFAANYSITLEQLIDFNNKTETAFISGKRK